MFKSLGKIVESILHCIIKKIYISKYKTRPFPRTNCDKTLNSAHSYAFMLFYKPHICTMYANRCIFEIFEIVRFFMANMADDRAFLNSKILRVYG